MKFAFTIGAYRLCDFVKLNILQLRELCPGALILVSDDKSPETPHMQKMCEELGVSFITSRERRAHFAGDMQALVNSVAFARAAEADVAVKISQRLILRTPEAINCLRKHFEDPNIYFASPGQPKHVRGNKQTAGFGGFAVLSDLVCTRVGSISPEEIIQCYRDRINNEVVPWKDFIEALVHALHINKFQGHSVMMPEFTDPTHEQIYLRRYQCAEKDYQTLAMSHGFAGLFPQIEWNALDQGRYSAKPVIV